MRRLQADGIFTHEGIIDENLQIILDDNGTVINLTDPEHPDFLDIEPEYYTGILIPGLINAHCHLELSHLFKAIPRSLGMISFIRNVMKQRGVSSEEERLNAARDADEQMRRNGIVAVGDISNTTDSVGVKSTSSLYYHTFIELLGLDPEQAEDKFLKGLSITSGFKAWSMAPHAPYTASLDLVSKVFLFNLKSELPGTIHMNESKAEREFLVSKEGAFADFYNELGFDLSKISFNSTSPVNYILKGIKPHSKVVFVHNTFVSAEEIREASDNDINLFWCLCPNANLYIEESLPDIPMLMDHNLKMVIGTDSLASNDSLSIIDEIRVIRSAFPLIPLEEILKWATVNGAELLGVSDRFGSFYPGKTPGVVQVMGLDRGRKDLMVKRIL